MKRFPLITLLLLVPALLLIPDAAGVAWQYDRASIGIDFAARLLTSQWTHWSASHLIWDALVLVALGVLCEHHSRARLLATVAASAIVIPLLVHHACPNLIWFRGLSGIDCGLFGLLLTEASRRYLILRLVAAGAFVGKVGFEIATGHTLFASDAGFVVAPVAHLAGFSIGVVIGSIRQSNFARIGIADPKNHDGRPAASLDSPAVQP